MRPSGHDPAYLWDMLDAACAAQEFVAGMSFSQYLADRRTRQAVERSLEIIGEAARKVSVDFQQAHPEIPWRGIIAQRHVLAHEYGEIKHERVWAVITEHLPALISLVEDLLPEPPGPDE